MPIDRTALVRRLYDEVFNKRDLAVADELVSPDFVAHGGPGGDVTGPDFIKRSATVLAGAFPDLHFDVDAVLEAGDRVVATWHMTGTHTGDGLPVPPTGERRRSQGLVAYRLDGDLLAEQWSDVQSVPVS